MIILNPNRSGQGFSGFRMLVVKEIWFVFPTEFDTTVTTLWCLPTLPALLKATVISPVSPGAIGSRGKPLGVVQPQVTCTFVMMRGSLPVFVKTKVCSTFSP